MACEVKTVKLSVIGLSCLQKLISHDAVAPSALKEILATLKDVSSDVIFCPVWALLSASSYVLESSEQRVCNGIHVKLYFSD